MGFHHGRSQGFEDAMRLSAPAPYERPDPRGRIPYRTDDNDEDMQRAIRASRHETRRGYATETPGAGPSRAPSRSAPRPAISSQPRAQAPPVAPLVPVAPSASVAPAATVAPISTDATAAPDHHDYELAIIIRDHDNFPDPANTKFPGFACIPLPFGYKYMGPNLVSIRGPARPPRLEDASSYLEMWAAFANGRTVPDPFRRFFNAGVRLDTSWLRNAVLGYGIVRRITVLHADHLDRNAINAFLVTLAAFERALDLCRRTKSTRSMWDLILRRDPSRPTNNWEGVRGFMNRDTYVLTTFGLTFTPPADPSHPWGIRTLWRRDAFMQVLLAIRPSIEAFNRLLAYADIFIRTHPANLPIPGIPLPNEPANRMYTASFVSGPACPDAFVDDPPPTDAGPSGTMETDEGPSVPPADKPAPHA